MTAHRNYTCNLCGVSIKDVGHDDRGFFEGVGMYFQISPNPPARFTRCNQAESHICLACIGVIKDYKAVQS